MQLQSHPKPNAAPIILSTKGVGAPVLLESQKQPSFIGGQEVQSITTRIKALADEKLVDQCRLIKHVKDREKEQRLAARELLVERRTKWSGYLAQLLGSGLISAETYQFVESAWLELSSLMQRRLSVPDAQPGESKQVLMNWDFADSHFEAEVFPDGHVELFSRQRSTWAIWSFEYQVGSLPSMEKEASIISMHLRPHLI